MANCMVNFVVGQTARLKYRPITNKLEHWVKALFTNVCVTLLSTSGNEHIQSDKMMN